MKNRLKNLLLLILILSITFIILEIAYRGYRHFKYFKEIKSLNDPLILSLGLNDRLEYKFKPNSEFVMQNGIKYKINSKGLRDKEFTYSKPFGVYRILILGDSYTFGWEEPLENAYPKLLEYILNKQLDSKYEVINAGVYGYNTIHEYEFLKREGIKYSPDLVIVAFVVNDAEPQLTIAINPYIENERVIFWFPEFIKYRLNLLFKKDIFILKRYEYTEHHWDSFIKKEYRFKVDKCFAALKNINNFLYKQDIPFLVVIFPSLDYVSGEIPPYEQYNHWKVINDSVRDFCQKENINFIDIYPYFIGKQSEKVIQKTGHFNKEGNLIAAKAISNYIKNTYDK